MPMMTLSLLATQPQGWLRVLLFAVIGCFCTFVGAKSRVKREDCVDAMDEYLRVRLPRMSLIAGILSFLIATWDSVRLLLDL